jgi:hypothetical protein
MPGADPAGITISSNTSADADPAHLTVDEAAAPRHPVASINILAALAIVWIGASKVLSIDLLRRKAEDDLRASRDDLDRRVQLRTHEHRRRQ